MIGEACFLLILQKPQVAVINEASWTFNMKSDAGRRSKNSC